MNEDTALGCLDGRPVERLRAAAMRVRMHPMGVERVRNRIDTGGIVDGKTIAAVLLAQRWGWMRGQTPPRSDAAPAAESGHRWARGWP